MSKRNSRAAKAARRRAREDHEVMRAILDAGPDGAPEIGVKGGRAGCPEVPRVPLPVEVMLRRPGAVRLPDEDLAEGMTAAVSWPCGTCGQVHISMWGTDLRRGVASCCYQVCSPATGWHPTAYRWRGPSPASPGQLDPGRRESLTSRSTARARGAGSRPGAP